MNYVTYSASELKKLQQELLLLLIEIDRICQKHNIHYYISYGTLLGAVRHQGFIPWDDDIDIDMPREDYERFCAVCLNELDHDRFFLQTQQTDPHYNWVYGKLRLKQTSFIRSGQEHLRQKDGFFLDIFPIDSISDSKWRQRVAKAACKACRKILWAPVGKKSSDSFLLRFWYAILSKIPRKWTIQLFHHFATRDNRNPSTSKRICHNLNGHIFEKEWTAQLIPLLFEQKQFPAPASYSNLLTSLYGDYMQLPPPEKRIGHCYASFVKFLDGTELVAEGEKP
ncbi:LicD family protein [Paenibacillus sp. B01]|uniref:LicD family protein n=1 Tax=Paenibacillus sp. B01 TaxID=2660554 RepID=UPI001E5A817D|nr:LicD family protein [Paenibacillus sp. B01]